MKSKFVWSKNYQSVIEDDRGHEVILDLPEAKGGEDTGTTALELCAMSLNGCIGTIFTMMAKKLRIEFTQLIIELEALKTDCDATITAVNYVLKIKTDAKEDKVQKCLELTETTCPVGVLYSNAGVKLNGKVELL